MTRKIELSSDEWLAELKAHIERFLETPSGRAAEFSLCEVFTDVPKHLDKHGTGVLAWHARMSGGKLHFAEGEVSDVDMKTTTDYAFIVPFARLKLDPADAQQVAAAMDEGAAQGKLVREGDRTKVPIEFHAIHNALAEITA